MSTPLLATKLYIPAPRSNHVPRPRLTGRLNAGLDGGLILVSAPAGFGKTSLVSEWVRGVDLPAGWVSLDEEDNDIARFLAYLIAALQKIDANIDDTALSLFRAPQPPSIPAVLTVLLNQIEEIPTDFLVVLDDYHLIEDISVHQAVDFLLGHLPPIMHLVLISRADPPLHLARLRGQGLLVELRMSDLRFSTEEAAEFFGKAFGDRVSQQGLLSLFERTEGWITGLHMAAMSMQGREDIPAFIHAFSGSHRYVLDYLVEEVLQQQPQEVRTFLFQTSILEGLNSSLCDAITGRSDSHAILDHLDRSNLFIVPLDDERCWYRYHHLFSDLLQTRLQEYHNASLPDLHRKASRWYEENGLITQAVDHALMAEDFDQACDLIEGVAERILIRSEVSTLLRWRGKLPAPLLAARTNLSFSFLWAQMIKGYQYDEVLEQAEHIADPLGVLAGRKAALLAFVNVSLVDMGVAGEHARQALERLPEDDVYFRSIALWVLGISQAVNQNLEGALQVLTELLRVSKQYANTMFIVMTASQLARLHLRLGHMGEAERYFEEALEAGRDRQGNLLPITSEAMTNLGEYYREINQLDKATEHLLEGIELSRQWRDVSAMEGYISLSRVKQGQGDWAAAQEALDKAMELALKYDVTDVDDRMVAMWQARLWLAQGKVEPAIEWVSGLVGVSDLMGCDDQGDWEYQLKVRESVVLTRLLILQGKYAEAHKWMDWQLVTLRKLARYDMVIEIHLLKAIAYCSVGELEKAIAEIKEALELAEPTGFVRIFLDEGPPVMALLQQARSRGFSPQYAGRLLAASGAPPPEESPRPQALVEPLSGRELDILRLLPTNLTTPEIAREMFLSVNTVRSHIKSIYSKLDVHKRSDVVDRAEELGLL